LTSLFGPPSPPFEHDPVPFLSSPSSSFEGTRFVPPAQVAFLMKFQPNSFSVRLTSSYIRLPFNLFFCVVLFSFPFDRGWLLPRPSLPSSNPTPKFGGRTSPCTSPVATRALTPVEVPEGSSQGFPPTFFFFQSSPPTPQ